MIFSSRWIVYTIRAFLWNIFICHYQIFEMKIWEVKKRLSILLSVKLGIKLISKLRTVNIMFLFDFNQLSSNTEIRANRSHCIPIKINKIKFKLYEDILQLQSRLFAILNWCRYQNNENLNDVYFLTFEINLFLTTDSKNWDESAFKVECYKWIYKALRLRTIICDILEEYQRLSQPVTL